MKVSVHTRGGALGLDRRVEVDDGRLTVSEPGCRQTTTLARDQWSRLDNAADHLASSAIPAITGPDDVVDGGYSDIEITRAGGTTSLRVPAGAAAPDAVWDLLEIVEEIVDPG